VLRLLLVVSLLSGAGADPMIGEILHLVRSIEKRALLTAVADSLGHSLGLRGDAASSSGSVHAKLKDLKDNPPSVVNSIQRGTITVSGSSNTATITSVTTSKAFLTFLGFTFDTNDANPSRWFTKTVLTNSTTVTADRSNGAAGAAIVSYEVVELK
jgi:hypothetical protein